MPEVIRHKCPSLMNSPPPDIESEVSTANTFTCFDSLNELELTVSLVDVIPESADATHADNPLLTASYDIGADNLEKSTRIQKSNSFCASSVQTTLPHQTRFSRRFNFFASVT